MAIKKINIGGTEHELQTTIANVENLDSALNGKADKSQAVFYIEGSGTTDTTNKVATWTGSHSDISEYYDGLTIAFKIGTAGSTTTTLNINNLGAVTVVKNVTTSISSSYGVNSIVLLTYTTDDSAPYWKTAEYDANTRNTVGDYQKNGTKLYFVGTTSSDSSATSSYATSYTNSNIYVNTSNVLYSAKGFSGDLTGDVTGNADTATSATSATKATQDASGNIITSTYETKTDADAKLATAKSYTDTAISNLINSTPTSITTGGWSNLEQSVSVSGVTASNTIIVTPAPESYEDYIAAGVYCSAQESDTLTFKCVSTPTTNLIVNVLILN